MSYSYTRYFAELLILILGLIGILCFAQKKRTKFVSILPVIVLLLLEVVLMVCWIHLQNLRNSMLPEVDNAQRIMRVIGLAQGLRNTVTSALPAVLFICIRKFHKK